VANVADRSGSLRRECGKRVARRVPCHERVPSTPTSAAGAASAT
jgi:hypothetical protein